MDLEDLEAAVLVRDADLHLPVEASRPAERGVQRVRTVRGADDDDLAARLQPVHQGQQLGDDAPLDLARHLVALRGDRVDLVDEDDGGSVLLGLAEDLAEVLLALSVELRDDLWAGDGGEVRLGLARDRAGEERLARARRPVEEDALRRLDPEALEQLRVPERELDHLAHLAHLVAEPAHVLVRHAGRLELLGLCGFLAHTDLRRPAHDDGLRPGAR